MFKFHIVFALVALLLSMRRRASRRGLPRVSDIVLLVSAGISG